MATRAPPSSAAPGSPSPHATFVGNNSGIVKLLALAKEAAPTDAPVLITGESGTGKEILAQMIHRLSSRASQPYVVVNCGAIAGSLEESELFGHVPGAFTGADGRKHGRFEVADHGTLFLDEIGETNVGLQVKLLRVLQNGEYAPVGAARNHHCDVRIVAATNQDLSVAVTRGAFRADLYYRLDVVRLQVPPLRDRKDDIPLLVRHFVKHYSQRYGLPEPRIDPGFYKALMRHNYPGNVRELSNYVHRAVIRTRGGVLSDCAVDNAVSEPLHLDASTAGAVPPSPERDLSGAAAQESFHDAKKRLIEAFEREYLISVLAECGGIVNRAAGRAGLSERGFHQKLRQYGIDGTSFRAGR